MEKKEYFEWLNIARGIGIFLVIVGHAIADTFGRKNFISGTIFNLIYSFHMPLFFFISGFLSYKIFNVTKKEQKKEFILKKIVRLLVPYFFIGIIYMILDLFLAKYESLPTSDNVILNLFLGTNPNFQLWTLYTLFMCSLLTCLLNKLKVKDIFILSCLMFILSLFVKCPASFVNDTLRSYIYFVIGIIVNKNLEKIKNFITSNGKNKAKNVAIVILIVVLFLIGNVIRNVSQNSTIIRQGIVLITAITGIFLTILVSIFIEKKNNSLINKITNTIGKYGMDIYIMGNLPQVFIRTIFGSVLGLPIGIVFIISVLAGIILPIIVSKYIVRKLKVLRILVLGQV